MIIKNQPDLQNGDPFLDFEKEPKWIQLGSKMEDEVKVIYIVLS